jgi:D-alanine-D-alanine ligase
VLGNEEPIASIPGEIVPLVSEWYDYKAKYEEGGMDLVVPPRLDEATIARVQELAVAAFVASDCEGMARVDFFVREEVRRLAVEVFKLVDCSGMARVDFFVEDGDRVLVNELNTIPGFTSTSVYAKLFEASGISYRELLDRLVELALERRDRRERLKY